MFAYWSAHNRFDVVFTQDQEPSSRPAGVNWVYRGEFHTRSESAPKFKIRDPGGHAPIRLSSPACAAPVKCG